MNTIDDRSASLPGAEKPIGADQADPFREATGRLRAEFDGAFTALRRSLFVERKALGLSIFESAFQFLTLLGLAATGIALTITAALLFVGSARRGLALLTEGAWWSDLVLAFALGATVVLVAHSVRRYVHRSVLASTLRGLASRTETTS